MCMYLAWGYSILPLSLLMLFSRSYLLKKIDSSLVCGGKTWENDDSLVWTLSRLLSFSLLVLLFCSEAEPRGKERVPRTYLKREKRKEAKDIYIYLAYVYT